MHNRNLLCALLALALVLAACGDDEKTETDTSPDTTGDADTTDGSDVTDEDMFIPIASPLYGPLRIAFEYADPLDPASPVPMYIVSPDPEADPMTQNDLTLLTSQIDCAAGDCMVSDDLRYFVYNQGGTLSLGEISSTPGIGIADLDEVAQDVAQVQLAGNRLAYISNGLIFYADLTNGLSIPQQMGEIDANLGDGILYIDGGIAIGARGDYMLVFRYDLSSMGMWKINLGTMEETFLYRFGIPRGSGSYFDPSNPFEVAQDGKTGILMLEGLTLYNTCTSNAGCMAINGGSCNYYTDEAGNQSSSGLCGANQVTLQTFDLDASDLGQACDTDADCTGAHRCLVDPTSLLDAQRKMCGPGQLLLGPIAPVAQACNILEPGQFAEVDEKLRITNDDKIVFLGKNDCGDYNISDNAVVSLDLSLDPASAVVLDGAYGADFDTSACYDDQEDRWDYPSCAIEIQDFEIGPDGGLVLRASGRNDQSGHELWAFDEAGNKYPITNDVIYDTNDLFAVSQ